MANAERRTETWFDLVDKIIDESVEREESVTVRADGLTVDVPLSFESDPAEAEQATWRLDGEVTVTIDGMRGSFAEWVHLFNEARREANE
ncbi:hypothetical protein BRD17_04980 [Halobacteriales archaeon SW_7_68_16]|nr:MAG: hypothetical protein BRD17_04980 [Halobacteriales archaeon SW_7_68_16]